MLPLQKKFNVEIHILKYSYSKSNINKVAQPTLEILKLNYRSAVRNIKLGNESQGWKIEAWHGYWLPNTHLLTGENIFS